MENSDWVTPSCLQDVTEEWVYNLIYHICELPPEKRKQLSIASINIESNLNSGEGALSDICHVLVRAKMNGNVHKEDANSNEEVIPSHITGNEITSNPINSELRDNDDERLCLDTIITHTHEERINSNENGDTCSKDLVYNLFIKLVPDGLKDLIGKHGLFEREITVYRYVL